MSGYRHWSLQGNEGTLGDAVFPHVQKANPSELLGSALQDWLFLISAHNTLDLRDPLG